MEEEKTPTMWTEELLTKYLRILDFAEVDPVLMEERARRIVPTEEPKESVPDE